MSILLGSWCAGGLGVGLQVPGRDGRKAVIHYISYRIVQTSLEKVDSMFVDHLGYNWKLCLKGKRMVK